MITTEQSRKEYIFRINKVVDYLESHLDEELNLARLAEIASFSPFHFHRIFTGLTGETVNSFVRRLRIERAAAMLLRNQEIPVAEIAAACGFNSPEVFSRTFRERYNTSATAFRKSHAKVFSKNRQTDSKKDQFSQPDTHYFSDEFITKNRNVMMEKNISVKQTDALDLLYYRHTGPFNEIKNAYDKLMKWAGPRGLLRFPETHTVTVYHDDPKVTDLEKLRQSACITVSEDVSGEGEFGKMQLPGGLHAVGHFKIHVSEFSEAWDAMSRWLADSGYQPAEGYPYEYYYDHTEDVNGPSFELDICIPVKPL